MARTLYHLTQAAALIAFGVWLLMHAAEPRPATVVWVGQQSHGSHFSSREPLNTTQQVCEAL